MTQKSERRPSLKFHPLTEARWPDFEKLFGPRGACGGCWCMWWRLKRADYERQKGDGNKRAIKALVKAREVPGLLAYDGGRAVAWCALAPREQYPVLERSRILKPVDEKPVWSITCFFVEKNYRKKGVTVELLRAAITYVKQQGGKIVEGYPVEPKKGRMPEVFAFTGLASAFKKAGFVECLRRSATRPIMRFYIEGQE
jgi:GNAT superfamily N-acetyltransferase